MDAFQERLQEEYTTLEEKIDKLDKFFESDIYASLPLQEQTLLSKQFRVMCEYHDLIEQRLELLNKENEDD